MKTTPPGWGKDGDANHTLEVEWDCCTPKDSTCTGKPLKSDGSPGDKK
jgi:hypothetical protein